MKIFSNNILRERDLDYTRWETFNGDYVKISEVSSSYIERSMDALEWHMQRYPSNINYPVWKHYMQVFEDELLSREYEEDLEEIAKERYYSKVGMPV